ncbi:unnamed protein product [Medioppia subpectinata]|uniref:Carboxylesterase type B domain-containing protein n=1 Tax=Medioppia subpectinata TaxID=1979941 RepID=A0A7R9PZU3_9ACAR|nr:unnamed protein product [Medioppia subpectinata]CAG2107349.1 unnamed protein product [Medioppia subpectinata]
MYILSEESDRKCRELCEEMSALKANNESEVKALKAQLNTAIDSMHTMTEEINDLKQSEEMSALKAYNECKMMTLRAQISTSGDSMQTMAEEINDLRQMLSTLDNSNQRVVRDIKTLSDNVKYASEEFPDLMVWNEFDMKTLKTELKIANDSMQTIVADNNDLKQKLCEMSTKNSELSEELSALKASKHIIESDVKLLDKEINAQNITSVEQDLSSNSSSIGSHNQLTTNSDKTRDEINIQEIFTEIRDQIKDQNKITNNLLNVLLREKEKPLTALEGIRQSVEDSDDSECIVFICIAFTAFMASLSPISGADPTVDVKTSSGTVRGHTIQVLSKPVNAFIGIPYAEPPIGPLRFARPKPLTKPLPGIIDATKPKNSCMTGGTAQMGEDCLFVNIWAPHNTTGALKPVMYWIYGGGLGSGSIFSGANDGKALVADDVVVASVNYRLRTFGFLYGGPDSDAPGNMGFYDQVLGLKWVVD